MTGGKLIRYGLVVLGMTVMLGCATSPPEQVDNVCDIFREKSGWYEDAKESRARWGAPVSVSMAFMYQESRFVATAKPPRKKWWGVIPGLGLLILMATRRRKRAPGTGTSGALETTGQIATILAMPLISLAGTTTFLIRSWVSTSRIVFAFTSPIMRGMAVTGSRATETRIG